MGNPQRVVRAKGGTVASTSGPPAGRGIDDYNNSINKRGAVSQGMNHLDI